MRQTTPVMGRAVGRSLFPLAGEAKVISDGKVAYAVVSLDADLAQKIANGLGRGDFTASHLADVMANAAQLATMPGRIARAK